MAKDEGERRLAAILNADVAGHSRLMHDDEAATVETLTKCRAKFHDLVSRYDGVGYGLVIVYPRGSPMPLLAGREQPDSSALPVAGK